MHLKLKPNQRDYLLQWLFLIVLIELVILLVPVYLWLKVALIGLAFLFGFLLRISKRYPGEYEPPAVDLITAVISFLFVLMFIIIKNQKVNLSLAVISPVLILVPHFGYIISNREIKAPGFRKILKRKSWGK